MSPANSVKYSTHLVSNDPPQDLGDEGVVAVAQPQQPLLLLRPPQLLVLEPHVLVRVNVDLVPASNKSVITKCYKLNLPVSLINHTA